MSTTDILALAAVIISVVSIVATVVFSLLQQKHNKNSVRPICEIKFADYEDKIAVYLRNYGTGPLIIKEIVCKDGERSAPTLLALMPRINHPWSDYTEDVTGWTIPVDGKVTLIELEPINEDEKYKVRTTLEQITIEIVYTDVYGKSKFTKNRKGDFFGRHYDRRFVGERKKEKEKVLK